ncbi:hypothetical protein C8J57DRAFT_1233822 [Mycena rebaudengoi]|nr:hypothetical protein C8J57DRAFT_1233822 [Mycena rebaudengoi]
MVVMNRNRVHSIYLCYCGCKRSERKNNLRQLMDNVWYPASMIDPGTCATFSCLEMYCLQNVVGTLNVHDYMGTLERLTDPTRMSSVPDRYKCYGRMSRQWAFLKCLKRAGRACFPDGVRHTKPGCGPQVAVGLFLLVICVGSEVCYHRSLYMLLLAMDANFRLKNCIHANEHEDESLGSGFSYFVESKHYKTHIKNYMAEEDVSTCIAFAALLQKETRLTTGLRVSGVGGCVCARDGVVRPLGMGDLQKGEWHRCTARHGILRHFVSVENPPGGSLGEDCGDGRLGSAHQDSCRTENSLSFAVGVGRRDGEGIERTWALLNPSGWATKEMGEGARIDSLEDKINYLNFEKNIHQGEYTQLTTEAAGFKQLDGTVAKSIRKKWQVKIDAWLADKTQDNPYCLKGGCEGGPSEAQVWRDLRNDEVAENVAGRVPINRKSVSAFLTAGLQLEAAQRRIRADLKGQTLVLADQASHNSHAGGGGADRGSGEARDSELPPPKVEDIKLWMPFEVNEEDRAGVCARGLPAKEGKLREAQWRDSLDMVRSWLHAKSLLILFRNAFTTGQRAATRSSTLIRQVGDRINVTTDKYRNARMALTQLRGWEYCLALNFRELKAADLHHTVREEMKQCLRMLRFIAEEWDKRVGLRHDVDRELAAGLKAYAARQASIHRHIAVWFRTQWDGSVIAAVRRVVEQDRAAYSEILDGLGVDTVGGFGLGEMEGNSQSASDGEGGDARHET